MHFESGKSPTANPPMWCNVMFFAPFVPLNSQETKAFEFDVCFDNLCYLVCPDTNWLNLVLPISTESPWRMTLVDPHFCDGSYTSQSVDPHLCHGSYICHSLKMHELVRKTWKHPFVLKTSGKCVFIIHTFPIMGCFAIVVLAYKVLKISYKNTPEVTFLLKIWGKIKNIKFISSSGILIINDVNAPTRIC